MAKSKKRLNKTMAGELLKSFRLGVAVLFCGSILFSCSGDGENNATQTQEGAGAAQQTEAAAEDNGLGVGPVTSVDLGEGIDEALATEGKNIYETKCSACHQLTDQKIVGPGLAGVTERRKPEWIMNMMINPEEMTKKDPAAKKLLAEHLTQMTNQDISESDARALLEYLRQNDMNN